MQEEQFESCLLPNPVLKDTNLTAEPLKQRLQQETGHIQLQNCHARVADASTVMVF